MPAKYGISGQYKEFDNNDKSIIHLPRQQTNLLTITNRLMRIVGSIPTIFAYVPHFRSG